MLAPFNGELWKSIDARLSDPQVEMGHFIKNLQQGTHGVFHINPNPETYWVPGRGSEPRHIPPLDVLIGHITELEVLFQPICKAEA